MVDIERTMYKVGERTWLLQSDSLTAAMSRAGERMAHFCRVIDAAFRQIFRLHVKPSRSSTVPPLCIDGHAYRRRTRSRQGRR